MLELMTLTRGGNTGVELYKKVFHKYWLRMKINDDLYIKETDQPRIFFLLKLLSEKQSVENTI